MKSFINLLRCPRKTSIKYLKNVLPRVQIKQVTVLVINESKLLDAPNTKLVLMLIS